MEQVRCWRGICIENLDMEESELARIRSRAAVTSRTRLSNCVKMPSVGELYFALTRMADREVVMVFGVNSSELASGARRYAAMADPSIGNRTPEGSRS